MKKTHEDETKEKTFHIRGGLMVVYRPVFRIGRWEILSVGSKPRDVLLFGIQVPHTRGVGAFFNQLSNRFGKK